MASQQGQVSPLLKSMILSAFFLQAPPPTQIYIGVVNVPAIAGVSAVGLAEPDDVNYDRAPYGIDNTSWELTDLTSAGNSLVIPFPAPGVDWGQVSGWIMTDGATSGTVLAAGPLVEPTLVLEGAPPLAIDALGIGVSLL